MPARSLHGFLNPSEPKTKRFWILAPLIGSLIFIVLYVVAAMLYPGGSQADTHSKGFSWMHNYWCNLLNEKALNGESNGARIVAMIGMAILVISLLIFWNLSAELLLSKVARRLLQLSGFLSMAVLPFLSSAYHDTIINLSGFFGLVAMTLVYAGVYKKGWNRLFLFGIFNFVLIAINNYIYYINGSLYYLPLVQKITFLSCLFWICLVDVKLYKQSNTCKHPPYTTT